MKTFSIGFALLAVGIMATPWTAAQVPAQKRSVSGAKWEYRVLTREQILDLGKKNLADGLNQLGEEGWELTAIDGPYIFKRPKGPDARRVDDLKAQLAAVTSDVELAKDRVSWTERMVKKGFRSKQQLQYEQDWLHGAEAALDRLQRELSSLQPESEKDRKKAK
jgi:hypothetical protein